MLKYITCVISKRIHAGEADKPIRESVLQRADLLIGAKASSMCCGQIQRKQHTFIYAVIIHLNEVFFGWKGSGLVKPGHVYDKGFLFFRGAHLFKEPWMCMNINNGCFHIIKYLLILFQAKGRRH